MKSRPVHSIFTPIEVITDVTTLGVKIEWIEWFFESIKIRLRSNNEIRSTFLMNIIYYACVVFYKELRILKLWNSKSSRKLILHVYLYCACFYHPFLSRMIFPWIRKQEYKHVSMYEVGGIIYINKHLILCLWDLDITMVKGCQQ